MADVHFTAEQMIGLCEEHNLEIFFVDAGAAVRHTADARDADTRMAEKGGAVEPGWYWWSCAPGCIPDSDFACGPFKSATQARENALEGIEEVEW